MLTQNTTVHFLCPVQACSSSCVFAPFFRLKKKFLYTARSFARAFQPVTWGFYFQSRSRRLLLICTRCPMYRIMLSPRTQLCIAFFFFSPFLRTSNCRSLLYLEELRSGAHKNEALFGITFITGDFCRDRRRKALYVNFLPSTQQVFLYTVTRSS